MGEHKDSVETVFRKIASDYVKVQGEELKKEFEMLERNSLPTLTPRLDAKVKSKLRRPHNKYGRIWGILVACLLVAIMIPVIQIQMNRQYEAAIGFPQATGQQEESATSENITEDAEVIPLGFTLPENFSVSKVEQDIGKTIYYLQDMRLDDVVLTLERSDGFIVPDGLDEYEINGEAVHGVYKMDYSFLTFEKDGIVYEMTSEHDMNTLLELGAAII